MIVVTLAGCIAAALLLGKSMTRQYLGEALVQLKFDGTPGLTNSSSGTPAVALSAAAVVEGEAEIIRSRAIARRVAERELQTAHAAPAAAEPQARRQPAPFLASIIATLADVRASAKQWMAGSTQEALGPTERRIVDLQSGLAVRNDGKTYLIKIDYAAADPAIAASLANAFAEEYLASRIEVSFDSAKRTSEWFASQVEAAKKLLSDTDGRVQEFRARTGAFTTATGEVTAPEQQLRDLVSQLSNARLERLKLEGKLQRLQASISEDRLPSAADLQSSGSAQRLIDAQVAAQQEADRIAASLGEKHPLYARARNALDDVRRQLQDAVAKTVGIVQADLSSARASERSLEQQMAAFEAASAQDRVNAKTLAQLESDAENARANLGRLEENYRQASAVAELKPIAAELVSSAEPLRIPVSPKMTIILALGCFAGLVASGGAVLLLELRDRGYVSGSDAFHDLRVSCAGMLPSLPHRANAKLRDVHDRSVRSLAVNAGLLTNGAEHSVVVVTSALPGEGKTGLARALATCLAQADRRVLIVENVAAARNRNGRASEAGSGVEPNAPQPIAIETLSRVGDDHCVTYYHRSTGSLSNLIDDPDRFRVWLKKSVQDFDTIIVEAPAVLIDPYAMIVARAANMVLFAVRWNSTPRQAAREALGQILPACERSDVHAVLTEVDLKRHDRLGLRDSLYFYRRYSGRRAARAA